MLSPPGYFTKPIFTEVLTDRKRNGPASTESINKHRPPCGKDSAHTCNKPQPLKHLKEQLKKDLFSQYTKFLSDLCPPTLSVISPWAHQHRSLVQGRASAADRSTLDASCEALAAIQGRTAFPSHSLPISLQLFTHFYSLQRPKCKKRNEQKWGKGTGKPISKC